MAADDGGVGADGRAWPTRPGVLVDAPRHCGVGHVGEHTARAEEDIVFTGDAGVQLTLFWTRSCAEHHIGTDDDVLPMLHASRQRRRA